MKELHNIYLQLKQKLDNLPSSCIGVSLPQVLERLKTDEEQPLSLLKRLNQLTAQDLKAGVLLYDLSGIGLYTLGPIIAAYWASQQCFTAFKAVILLPIERRHLFQLHDVPQSIEDFFKIWGLPIDPLIKPEDLLIVISGHSGDKLRANTANRDEENGRQQEWLKLIDTLKLHYMIVSNQSDQLTLKPQRKIPLSLQPFDLGVYHLKDTPEETAYTLPGSVVLSEAKAAIEQTLFKEITKGSIDSSPEWHQQVFNFRHINELSQSSVTIPHLYSSVRIQTFIKTIAHALDSTITTKPSEKPITLSTAQEWFCAAIMHKSKQGPYAYYRVGNDLIVRNLENNYLAGIPEGALASLSTTYPEKTMNDLKFILQQVIADPNFEHYDAQEMIKKMQYHKDQLCTMKHGMMNQRDYKYFSLLLKLLNQHDPNQKSKHLFSRENTQKITYRAFQIKINEEIQHTGSTHITQKARQILKGNVLKMPNYTTALSATLIGEPSRYELSFLVMLCLLDVIENDGVKELHYWQGMFAHPQHDQPEDTLENAMLADIVHLLGGYQVMSHGNSREQTDPSNPQPQHGIHWVDFKSVVVLIRWLALSFDCEKTLNPHLMGELLTRPLENKYVFKDSFEGVMQNGIGRAHSYLFDRLARRVECLEYMLTPQQPLRETCPSHSFETWARQQQYPSNARIRYPDRPGDCLRVMCYTPFGELCHGVLDRKPESFRLAYSLMPIFVQGKNIHPLEVNKLFHNEPEKFKEMFLDNLILQDPDFYQCYFFKSLKVYLPQNNHPALVSWMMRLKNNIPQNHPQYHNHIKLADTMIDSSLICINSMLKTALTESQHAEKIGSFYCYRAYVKFLAEKPIPDIMKDLQEALQPTIELPNNCSNFAQTLLTQYQSNTTPNKKIIEELGIECCIKLIYNIIICFSMGSGLTFNILNQS